MLGARISASARDSSALTCFIFLAEWGDALRTALEAEVCLVATAVVIGEGCEVEAALCAGCAGERLVRIAGVISNAAINTATPQVAEMVIVTSQGELRWGQRDVVESDS